MTTEHGIPQPRTVRIAIEELRERADYLDAKLESIARARPDWDQTGTLAYRELSALRWALPVLEAEWDRVMRLHRTILSPAANVLQSQERRDAHA